MLAALGLLLPSITFAQKSTDFLAAPQGRYVVGQLGEARTDQYLLDTHTGRLWQIIPGSKGVRSLEPVPYIEELKTKRYTPPPVRTPQ